MRMPAHDLCSLNPLAKHLLHFPRFHRRNCMHAARHMLGRERSQSALTLLHCMQGDVYQYLQSQRFAKSNLVFQREGGPLTSVNIGLIYCRDCALGGRGQWVLDETLKRIEQLLELPDPQAFFAPMIAAGILSEVRRGAMSRSSALHTEAARC